MLQVPGDLLDSPNFIFVQDNRQSSLLSPVLKLLNMEGGTDNVTVKQFYSPKKLTLITGGGAMPCNHVFPIVPDDLQRDQGSLFVMIESQ